MSADDHGSVSTYTNYRCRCEECVAAHNQYQNEWSLRNREHKNAYQRMWRTRRKERFS